MKHKKILAGLLVSCVTITWISYSFADDTNTGSAASVKEFAKNIWGKMFKNHFEKRWGEWRWMELTDAEKTALESMTQEDKQAFFEAKRSEQEAKREEREVIIDTLLSGGTLTSNQEIVRAEIIKERALQKADMEERKIQMETIKTLLEKKKSGETLTSEEETTLKTIKWKKWDFKGRHR